MPKKKGFIAISLIYSFFLVFLMIMLSSAVKNTETRLMLKVMKDDIKASLNGENEFIVTTLPSKNPITGIDYKVGNEVNFVGESWLVIENKANSVVLVLKRALNRQEITSALEVEANNNDYFGGMCNDSSCKVRMCMSSYYSNFCFYESSSNYEYYTWNRSIGKKIVEGWFEKNVNLQKACRLQYNPTTSKRMCSKNTLIYMTFHDGFQNNQGYIRLATRNEANNGRTTWVPNNGGFLAPESWSVTFQSRSLGKSKIYTIDGSAKQSQELRTIRPVIEVRKS